VPGVVLVSDDREPIPRAETAARFDSFDAAFAAGYQPLVRSLTVICGDREMAADCVQEAFVKAYTRWGRISRYDEPLAWVRRVAINQARDHGRKHTRGQRAMARLGADEPATIAEPAAMDLAAVLAELPPQQRIAAALFYVEELSVAEIAVSMKLSEGAVKYHLHAARDRLRRTLAPLAEDLS
jgi:RNA polymerase sigma-70 factor (ECF subfamily)